jgi:CelD/BcsL family acetyltransferase involved in cellulose biosynthesis
LAAVDGTVIAEPGALERLYAPWDALARARQLPLMSPAWLLAWWRHLAPEGAQLRTVAVHAGGELVGLAPFYVVPARRGRGVEYRLLGSGLGSPLAPLAAPGGEREVAAAMSRALSQAEPRPDLIALNGTPLASRWHVALRDGWPGRPRPVTSLYRTSAYATVLLQQPSMQAWLATRSAKFRSSMRRLERLFGEAGGTRRLSTAATLVGDIETFQRLHAARWRGRSDAEESTVVAYGARMTAMLTDVGRRLIADERFRLWVMEVDGTAIACDIYLCGGGVAVGVNGGWDERWKPLSPPLLATMHAIEESFARGERRVDLGPGGESHKMRFANANSPVAWSVLLAPGRRLARTLAQTTPTLASNAAGRVAKRVLTPAQANQLREMRRMARRSLQTATTRRRSG